VTWHIAATGVYPAVIQQERGVQHLDLVAVQPQSGLELTKMDAMLSNLQNAK